MLVCRIYSGKRAFVELGRDEHVHVSSNKFEKTFNSKTSHFLMFMQAII